MFYIYFLYITLVIPVPLTQQYSFESANKEENDKILAKWLGVEIDGAYFFDWTTEQVEQTAEKSRVDQQAGMKEADAAHQTRIREGCKGSICDAPDHCFPVLERSRSSMIDFMRILERKCWDDLLPVTWECSAHSGAERANTPATCYHILTHVAVFLIVAKLLYIL